MYKVILSCKRTSVYLLDHITENQLKTYSSKIKEVCCYDDLISILHFPTVEKN
jgi:hypothetical protein